MIAKSPTDRFIIEMVTSFYAEAFNYQGYLQMSPDDWVRGRIRDTKLKYTDKERAMSLVKD